MPPDAALVGAGLAALTAVPVAPIPTGAGLAVSAATITSPVPTSGQGPAASPAAAPGGTRLAAPAAALVAPAPPSGRGPVAAAGATAAAGAGLGGEAALAAVGGEGAAATAEPLGGDDASAANSVTPAAGFDAPPDIPGAEALSREPPDGKLGEEESSGRTQGPLGAASS